jgi:phytanoyl-CoA hydroxylase
VTVEEFQSEGYFVAPDVFSPSECDRIVELLDGVSFELPVGDAKEGPLSYRPMVHLGDADLLGHAADPRWAALVLPLLGDSARLYWEQAVAKPPQARTELPWHQDNGYAPTDPEEYVTCWLALDDADVDNGCLWVLPASHRQGTLRHHRVEGAPFRSGYDGDEEGVAVSVSKGSVLVFSSLLMHRSGPNTTDRYRRAWILQYCSAHARHGRTGELLDDRLLVAAEGRWLDEPVRERDIDLLNVFRNHERD